MSFAQLPTAVPAARRRKRCSHRWTLSHQESEWTMSGYHITATCHCGAATTPTRAEADAYIQTHQLPIRKAAP